MNSCPLIPADWDLPSSLRIRLGYGPGRQRCMEAEGHLLLVLHELPKPHQPERVGRLFWREPNGNWHSSTKGAGTDGLDQHLDSYQRTLDRIAEAVESARNSEACFKVLGELSPIARATHNLYTTLRESRKHKVDDEQLLNWRDKAYELTRRVDLLQDDTKTALNFEIAHQAELQAETSHQMASSAHRLNVLAAFFFPLATLSAVLGTNLEHVFPSVSQKMAMAIMLIVGLLLGSGLTYLVTRPAIRPGKHPDVHDKN